MYTMLPLVVILLPLLIIMLTSLLVIYDDARVDTLGVCPPVISPGRSWISATKSGGEYTSSPVSVVVLCATSFVLWSFSHSIATVLAKMLS